MTLTEVIDSNSVVGVIVAIDCGELEELRCLCNPEVRSAYERMLAKFNSRERELIFKKLCGCTTNFRPPVLPPAEPTPVAGPPVAAPAPNPPPVQAPTPPPPPAAPQCPTDIPPQGFFTGEG